jgi:hypothetical protein
MDLRAVGEALEEVDRHADTDDPGMVLGVFGHGFPCLLKKHYSMSDIGRVEEENGVCQAGIFPGLSPVGLSSHGWKGCRGGVCPKCNKLLHGHASCSPYRVSPKHFFEQYAKLLRYRNILLPLIRIPTNAPPLHRVRSSGQRHY